MSEAPLDPGAGLQQRSAAGAPTPAADLTLSMAPATAVQTQMIDAVRYSLSASAAALHVPPPYEAVVSAGPLSQPASAASTLPLAIAQPESVLVNVGGVQVLQPLEGQGPHTDTGSPLHDTHSVGADSPPLGSDISDVESGSDVDIVLPQHTEEQYERCLLYTSDAADE